MITNRTRGVCNERDELPVLFVPPEVVDAATRSSEPSEFCGGVGVGSGGGAFTGGSVGGC